MHTTLIYVISLASAVGMLVLWKVYQLIDVKTRRAIFLYARKKLLYTLVYRRRSGSDNVNVPSLLSVCLLIAANITVCALNFKDRKELAKRCGSLSLVNMVPLFLGGQRSTLTDRVLHLGSTEQSLLHRWMGRVCVVQGLVHGIVFAMSTSPTVIHILVSILQFTPNIS
jgi:hypothetical protein